MTMYEMMFDLETLDTKPSAVVLSVGAVVWETMFNPSTEELSYEITERFLRVLNIQEQVDRSRTVSQSTLLWWQRQDRTAQQEAFNPVRQPVEMVLNDLRGFVDQFADPAVGDEGINRFWASPATFDFPIWDDLAMTFGNYVPWSYRQKYDVRTVVQEANLSAKGHSDPALVGIAHTPVYDCEWQISLLTAARQRLNRRTGVAFGPRVD
jgi:hypothetical protein